MKTTEPYANMVTEDELFFTECVAATMRNGLHKSTVVDFETGPMFIISLGKSW